MVGQDKELGLFKYLPSGRRALIHFFVMLIVSCLLGPLIGPVLSNWINPPQAWGISTRIGDYSLMNVLLWGLAFLMFEVFFYTGWLISLARKGWEEGRPKSWYN
ncbi:hypothetical protein GALL_147640 [mine drainage metagenome]|uniref:Uncharacterized protein n=1 Tax=mine drainage metagenome TaxID=410659 RepID=A0A1J5SNK0_9ZZZZ